MTFSKTFLFCGDGIFSNCLARGNCVFNMSGENPVFRRIENVAFHLGRWGWREILFRTQKKNFWMFWAGNWPCMPPWTAKNLCWWVSSIWMFICFWLFRYLSFCYKVKYFIKESLFTENDEVVLNFMENSFPWKVFTQLGFSSIFINC